MSERSHRHSVIVQIRIKLLRVSKPPVWRQLQLRGDTRLDHLHEIIQTTFGWENYHLHCFSSDGKSYGVPDPELGFIDERAVRLDSLISSIGDRLRYTYDFGDDWEHEILVEDLLDPDPELHYPVLIAAKGTCPPEDCGGAWGYGELKEVLADPNHEQHPEMLEWLGLDDASEFDPCAVSTDHIEYELALSGAGR